MYIALNLTLFCIIVGLVAYIVLFHKSAEKKNESNPNYDTEQQQESKKNIGKKKEKVSVMEEKPDHELFVTRLKGGIDSTHAGAVIDIATSEHYIATVRKSDHYIRMWKGDTVFLSNKRHALIPIGSINDFAICCAISPDEKYLAYAIDYSNIVIIYDISNEKDLRKISEGPKEKRSVKQIRFTEDGKYLISMSEGSDELLIRKVPNAEVVQKFNTANLQIYMFDMHRLHEDDPTQQLLSCASFTSMLKIFHLKSTDNNLQISKEFTELKGHSLSINCVSFHKTRREIASVSKDGTLKIFTTLSLKERVEKHRTSKERVNVDEVILFDKQISKITSSYSSIKNQNEFIWIKHVADDRFAALCRDKQCLLLFNIEIHSKKLHDIQIIDHKALSENCIESICVWKDQYLVTGDTEGVVKIWKAVK